MGGKGRRFHKLYQDAIDDLGFTNKLMAYLKMLASMNHKTGKLSIPLRVIADDFEISLGAAHALYNRARVDRGISLNKLRTKNEQPSEEIQGVHQGGVNTFRTEIERTTVDKIDTPLPPIEKSEIPPGIDPELWEAFRNGRAQNKKKMTEVAESRMLKRLVTLQSQGHDPNAMLDQSIRTGWADVFPVKADHLQSQPRSLESL